MILFEIVIITTLIEAYSVCVALKKTLFKLLIYF